MPVIVNGVSHLRGIALCDIMAFIPQEFEEAVTFVCPAWYAQIFPMFPVCRVCIQVGNRDPGHLGPRQVGRGPVNILGHGCGVLQSWVDADDLVLWGVFETQN